MSPSASATAYQDVNGTASLICRVHKAWQHSTLHSIIDNISYHQAAVTLKQTLPFDHRQVHVVIMPSLHFTLYAFTFLHMRATALPDTNHRH